jgi:hypothetical protein
VSPPRCQALVTDGAAAIRSRRDASQSRLCRRRGVVTVRARERDGRFLSALFTRRYCRQHADAIYREVLRRTAPDLSRDLKNRGAALASSDGTRRLQAEGA